MDLECPSLGCSNLCCVWKFLLKMFKLYCWLPFSSCRLDRPSVWILYSSCNCHTCSCPDRKSCGPHPCSFAQIAGRHILSSRHVTLLRPLGCSMRIWVLSLSHHVHLSTPRSRASFCAPDSLSLKTTASQQTFLIRKVSMYLFTCLLFKNQKKRGFFCASLLNEFGNQPFLDSRFLVDFSTFSFFARTSSYESKKVSGRFPVCCCGLLCAFQHLESSRRPLACYCLPKVVAVHFIWDL